MISLQFKKDSASPLQVLCLGCHSDDIEIGCGGTVLHFGERYPESNIHWVVFSASGVRGDEAKHAAQLFVDQPRLVGPTLREFPDGFMPFVGADVKAVFEQLKTAVSPDIVFTHNRNDAHQDHRLISELTWNTFRNHLILEYEIPKYDGDLGRPSVFVPLTRSECDRKIKYIMESFQSQHSKRWFERDTFLSLMRLRGMECNADSGYAEAFYSRKLVL